MHMQISACSVSADIAASGVPISLISGWMDQTANSAIQAFYHAAKAPGVPVQTRQRFHMYLLCLQQLMFWEDLCIMMRPCVSGLMSDVIGLVMDSSPPMQHVIAANVLPWPCVVGILGTAMFGMALSDHSCALCMTSSCESGGLLRHWYGLQAESCS